MIIPVDEMYMGETAEIVSIDGNGSEIKMLKSMGLREGKLIDLLLHDPTFSRKVVLGADNSRIAFDSRLARNIRVLPLKNCYEMLKIQAHYDSLTGCLTRHAADRILRDELEKYAAKGVPLTLLLADIDHFKMINDTFGHGAGDGVLNSFAGLVKGMLRRSDIFCRWGGEEFLILLRGTLVDEAARIAERIRENVAACTFPPFEGSGFVTVSIGGSGLPPGRQAEHLIADADKALYQAKKSGRNRVKIC